MQLRYRGALVAGLVFALSLALTSGSAQAAKSQFSIGGNFGTGIYSNSDINKLLKADTPPRKEIKSGWEYGGTLRYGISNKVSLDAEVNSINAKATTTNPSGNGDEKYAVKGIAVPVNIILALAENDKYTFNLFAGAGPLLSAKLTAQDDTNNIKTDSQTTITAQGGFEGMMFVSPKFAITARALGRTAKISDLQVNGVSSTPKLDADLSGAAFSLGLRAFFGGK
ncbi:MAG: outer membrane beta-barrel protein [Candidatus Eisenbacteria bacterium]